MSAKMRSVLLVDDDDQIRSSLARVLRAKGYDVREACDGNSAIAVALEQQPDMLILDVRMPGMDGVETFVEIRREFPAIPAVFMTAYASGDRAAAAIDAGGLRVLPKPLELNRLCGIIEDAISSAPVLIVDDNAHFLRSLARSLHSAGIPSVTVDSLKEAVLQVRQRPNRVVIADVFLKDGRGFELLAESGKAVQPPPLILVTGHADWYSETDMQDQLSSAETKCLPKPLDIDDLIATVRKLQPIGDSENS